MSQKQEFPSNGFPLSCVATLKWRSQQPLAPTAVPKWRLPGTSGQHRLSQLSHCCCIYSVVGKEGHPWLVHNSEVQWLIPQYSPSFCSTLSHLKHSQRKGINIISCKGQLGVHTLLLDTQALESPCSLILRVVFQECSIWNWWIRSV